MVDARRIEEILKNLRAPATVAEVVEAEQVVRYRLVPGDFPYASDSISRYVKVSEIVGKVRDIEVHLGVPGLRFEQNGPLWLEVPKEKPDIVEAEFFLDYGEYMDVPAIIGKTVEGEDLVLSMADSRTPHILIAGATGSGKSVCVNTIITGMITTKDRHDIGLALIDPKYVELAKFAVVPHLIMPIANDPPDAVAMLDTLILEMNARYSGVGRRFWQTSLVLVVDEYADLVSRSRAIERKLVMLAQKGRAAGIHIVLATQRPSVDVVTGAIKANFPVRIAFAVAQGVDSRVILDHYGAETLTGNGDGIIKYGSKTVRFKGAYFTEEEMDFRIKESTEFTWIVPPPDLVESKKPEKKKTSAAVYIFLALFILMNLCVLLSN
jgi:DNA segregation ATPase FtsK/SpoIIIE, S-DNA-T family